MADARVVADTNLIIDFLRASDPGRTWVRRSIIDGRLRVTAVSAFELRLGSDFLVRRAHIEAILLHRTLPLDLLAGFRAGEVFSRLRREGRAIGVNDALIAGICLRFDLPLATRDVREFRRVEGLRMIEVGESMSGA